MSFRDLIQDLMFGAGLKPVLRRESLSAGDISGLAAWMRREGALSFAIPPSGGSTRDGILYVSRDPAALEEARRLHPLSTGPAATSEGRRPMRKLLAYPSCCAAAHARYSGHAERNSFVRPLRCTDGTPSHLLNTGMPERLILVPHQPCSFRCQDSIRMARRCERLIREREVSFSWPGPIDQGMEILSAPLVWWDFCRWIAFLGAAFASRSGSRVEARYRRVVCSIPDDDPLKDVAVALRHGTGLVIEGRRLTALDAGGSSLAFDVPPPMVSVWDDDSWKLSPSPIVGYCVSGNCPGNTSAAWNVTHERLDEAGYFVRTVLMDRLPSPEGQLAALERACVDVALITEPPGRGTALPFIAVWTLGPAVPETISGCRIETMPPANLLLERLRQLEAGSERMPGLDLGLLVTAERLEREAWDASRDYASSFAPDESPASEAELRRLLAPCYGRWVIASIERLAGRASVRVRSSAADGTAVVLIITPRDDLIQVYRRTGSFDVRLHGSRFSPAEYALADAVIDRMAEVEAA